MNAAERLLGEEALAAHGGRVALVCGAESITYAQLAERVRRASGVLAALGVRPGDRVLLMMRNTPDFAAAWLGAMRCGAVAVGVNDRLAEPELRHILADSSARLAIIENAFADERLALLGELAAGNRLVLAGAARSRMPAWDELCRKAGAAAAFDAHPDSPAFTLYTSGTTGRPKGIVHAHRSFLNLGQAFHEIGVGAGDLVFTTSKLFFAYGLEHGLLGPLAFGAASVLDPDWAETDAVIDVVARYRPVAVFSVPTIYRRLLAEPRERLAAFRSVRRFVAGGERLSTRLVAQWREATGGEILNLYGMSETFCACMITPSGTSDGLRTGKPLTQVQVRIAGDSGVLWVKHPAQATGYANLPEQSRAVFKDGWFCTQDVFAIDDQGFFVHQGRADEMVKVAGQWVRPGELEEAVASEPEILEAACVAASDGDGLERLALFVTARGDPKKARDAAARACERALPGHKRPKWLRVVEQFPRTATGKIQRFKLREMLHLER
jgi:3-hydroxybenzoate/4-hydroxybenzoate---CoA ligase